MVSLRLLRRNISSLETKKISVAICTHNRAADLLHCLNALASQGLAPDFFEVLIVDNGSTDNTKEISLSFTKGSNHFRYVFEKELGLAHARNIAINLSHAPFIAFTDDDALPQQDWLQRIVERFENLDEDYAILAGEIDPIWPFEPPDWLTDHMLMSLSARVGWDKVPRELKASEWACEVNSTYRTDVLRKAGGFPTKLGRRGDLLLSGENHVNSYIVADGWRVFYDPDIKVKHKIHPNRLSQAWMKRRYFWQGVTSAICAEYDKVNGKTPEYWSNIELPHDAKSWQKIFDDNLSRSELSDACRLLTSLGYLLSIKGLLVGR
jgi:glycosyltransferase involved in cell wall biosynthesis